MLQYIKIKNTFRLLSICLLFLLFFLMACRTIATCFSQT